MKLYCAAQGEPGIPDNFGDALNFWLWDKFIPGVLDQDESTAFVGIGTLLSQKLVDRTPNAIKRAVFSSGVGYGKKLTNLDETYSVYCVRGPLSAKSLELPDHAAVTDGAVLIRRVVQPQHQKKYRYAYMPHHNFAGEGWRSACDSISFCYIDPYLPIDTILSLVDQTEVLLTEAMHGAIVADALRVPWVPVSSHSAIFPFKWQDWCATINVPYNPFTIDRLHQPRPTSDLLTPIRRIRDWSRQNHAAQQLKRIANQCNPCLSDEAHLENLTVELETRLDAFRTDVAAGRFQIESSDVMPMNA